jgi:PAS domain S-box-containing protein
MPAESDPTVISVFIAVLATLLLAVLAARLWQRSLLRQVKFCTAELSAAYARLERGETVLQATDERMRAIFQADPDCIKLMDREGRIMEMNTAGLAMFQADSPAQVLGRPVLELIAPEYREDYAKLHQRVMDGESLRMEHEVLALKGGRLWLETDAVPLRDHAGEVAAHLAVTRDISGRKAMEHELMQYFEQPLLGLLTASPMKGTIHVNQRFCDMVGYSKEEVRSMDWGQLTHPDDLAANQALLEQALRGEIDSYQMEKRYIHKDGNIVYVHLAVNCVRNAQGKVEYFIGMVLDITERKQAEEALHHNQAMLIRTEALSHIGSWEWQVKADSVTWTDEMFQIFKRDPTTGAPSFAEHPALFPPDDMERLRMAVEDAVNKGVPYALELRAIQATGEIRHCIARGQAKMGSDGRVERLSGSFQDVTESHRIEQELIAARDAANASARAKSEFLANMSHEIRTPMNGIIGLTRLALDQTLSPKVRDYLENVLRSSDSLLKILNDILDYSKIEAGLLSIEDNVFDLDEMLDMLRNLFSINAEEKSLALAIEVADGVPRLLLGDGLRLQQVLANLLGNAIKFTEQGKITLSVGFRGMEQGKAELSFCVADTGIGMGEDTLANLFRPFTQADATITRRFGGTGLGLAISHKLLALLGSEFKVESRVGQGTRFSFDIAIKLAPAKSQAQNGLRTHPLPVKRQEVRPGVLAGTRVLVAEDNRINRLVVCELLRGAGIQVATASNGHEVLALVGQEAFDAVLMDVQMPEMNGLEATRQLREDANFTTLPVIAITAGVTDDERDRALASGMNGFLTKPIDAESLLRTLAQWIAPSTIKGQARSSHLHQSGTGYALHLNGFDLENILSAMGSNESVINLLSLFRQDAMAMMGQVEKHLAAGDMARAQWHLHKFKGVAGNVGAIFLHAAAATLDEELRQGGWQAGSLAALRSAYRSAIDALDDLQHSACPIAASTGRGEDFKATVARIDKLLAGHYLITDELLALLEAATPPNRLGLYRQVKGHIGSINYQKAREALNRLAED